MTKERCLVMVGASALVLVCGMVFAGISAAGPRAPKGGTMAIEIPTPPGSGATSPIVVVGAVGDYGTATAIDKDGKTSVSGPYLKVALSKGGFEINLRSMRKGGLTPGGVNNPSTCSREDGFSGSVTVFDGTGLYKGIAGTLHVTIALAEVLPRVTHGEQKGQCNEIASPVKSIGTVSGSGTVSF